MDRLRRTMMFVPGSNAAMLRDCTLYGADSIMFDLEDAVSLSQKDTARLLVYSALKTFDYGGVETVARINSLEAGGAQDVEAMVLGGIDVIRLPKTETAQDIRDVDEIITAVERKYGIEPGRTRMMAAIEGAAGVLNSREIAHASPRMMAIALGAEDYVTSQKTYRYPDGAELFFARNFILHAAREAGIAAIDTVFSDIDDEEGLVRETKLIKQLGFDGKSVINPRQIPVIDGIFAPSPEQVAKARGIVEGLKEAESRGSGVVAVNGQMVDKPVVERAQRTLALAQASGMKVE
ncbi:citrate lyase beta subunit [Bifidobacterium actinocoloniiforme DSM 22766]|uniref:Citrate lyase subunit beta n=1 Tax=Bifidobacterium actinocoloniiforme DSM 22766 TaxID=1437605 RepID=A0A086YYM9_9BIFI|nr:aldolase/citrate lyase family protein [Bifidobacterium actinocoloniiforme]AKV55902.1 citrate lyase subunit beta [Bifidobacterium actinocoloniiforme DSM 22766]KFI39379.1 citrate lyase beta subunit [Bifidobacterium actinocoloniiforme DSM 22766]